MNSTFYSELELQSLGITRYGKNVLISRKCSIYEPEKLTLGNNVRIDDFCILSGNISIGSWVHISTMVTLFGRNGIFIDDFSGVSSNSIVYSAVDDFSGNFLIGPMVPQNLTRVTGGPVVIEKSVQIGASCVVMPNVRIGNGSVVGAMSFVNKDVEEWKIVAGIPVRVIKDRSKNLLNLTELIAD